MDSMGYMIISANFPTLDIESACGWNLSDGSQEYSTAVASQASTVWHRQVRGKQRGSGRIGRGVLQVTGISPEKKPYKSDGTYPLAMENGPGLKMYSLLKMVIFHCHVSLLEGSYSE